VAVSPEDHLAKARAAEAAGDYATAVPAYRAAYSALRAGGDSRRAALVAGRELSFLYTAVYGNDAAAAGWLALARRLIDDEGDCLERGWVELAKAMTTNNPDEKAEHVRAAADAAESFGDADLRFAALAYQGVCDVMSGRLAMGMHRLDEAAAAASAGEVGDYLTVGEIYCKMLLGCELTLDVRRAQQWMAVAASLEEDPGSRWVPAICRMHYGGILTVAGRWVEADVELSSSVRLYDTGYRALRSGTMVRLAELRLRQGRYEEAARLLSGHEQDCHAIRPLVRLHLVRGETERAVALLRRFIANGGAESLDAAGLALAVEAYVAAGLPAEARDACAELRALASGSDLAQLRGLAAYSAGLVEAESGGTALGHFEAAMAAFSEAAMPLELARTQLALATHVADSDAGLAVAEASEALRTFERMAARPDADAAAGLMRRLGNPGRAASRRPGPLTRRESEVLALIAEGLSNGEIAERLVVSKRTVEHHVGSILGKLAIETRPQLIALAATGELAAPVCTAHP
jgi:DNA-binding CsgD family transcriptional regulator